eukprot:TRINITY_DN17856_c0_g1_i1.p1 TRINITY_DN17856_c0_g1~~TRINITY_DN17856_c0_g1_i1.p1  ORF type:complete len:1126 (+),score=369.89 TRINITY_DN17856_c0_g1_i1:122-3499(+)
MSYAFGSERKQESAVEASRRERAERAEKRQKTTAQTTLARAYRRHAALKHAAAELRQRFDAAFESDITPTPAAAKKLRLGEADLPLPSNKVTYQLLRFLLFFYTRKWPRGAQRDAAAAADEKRLVNMCCLVSASVTRPAPAENFAVLSCDAKHTQDWTRRAKAWLQMVTGAMRRNVSTALNRIEYGAMSKMLMDLTEAKRWGFVRLQSKGASKELQAVLQTMMAAAAQRCEELLRCLAYEADFFALAAAFFTRHVPPAERKASKAEDVMATITLRICLSAAASDAGARASLTDALICIPHFPQRMPVKVVELVTEPAELWDAIVDRCMVSEAAATKKQLQGGYSSSHPNDSDDWPSRYLFANVMETGCRFVMDGRHVGRWGRWLTAMQHLIQVSPGWGVIKRCFETEPLLDAQMSLLWSAPVVSGLFGGLLQEDGSGVPAAAAGGAPPAAPPATKKKGFLARLREKAASSCSGSAKDAAGKGGKSTSAAYGENPLLAAVDPATLKAKSFIPPNWATPAWLPACEAYLAVIAKWSGRVVLSALAARSFLLVALWQHLEANIVVVNMLVEGDRRLLPQNADEVAQVLLLFLCCYEHFLPVCDDYEFYTLQQPFPLTRVTVIVTLLAKLAIRLAWADCLDPYAAGLSADARRIKLMQRLKSSSRSLLLLLHDRNVRRAFAPEEIWMVPGFCKALGFVFDPAKAPPYENEAKVTSVVQDMPFMIPFAARAQHLRRLVEKDREAVRMDDIKFGLNIRREYLFEDAVERVAELVKGGPGGTSLSTSRSRLKARFHVVFKNAQGLEEAGIDAGGVFKEFIEAVAKRGFDPNLGLFKGTEDNKFYPNPQSKRLYGHAYMLRLYEFMGRIIGKAVYEGVVLNVPFAEFFLNTLLGRANFVEDLKTLDPDFHKNLVQLKEIDDVDSLCLTFSYEEDSMGEMQTVNLIPNGSEVDVTNDNLIQYIATLAHAKLNTQFREQAAAFISGFHDIIPPRWTGLFNRNELQQLISGMAVSFDVGDMRAHTKYAGGYSDTHAVVKQFWKILAEFDDEQKGAFLAFVTASSKPPLLGFAHLQPPFCIRCADADAAPSFFGDIDRLPSASTCFNLLKLPPYKSKKNMKDKLMYSIKSGAGFELS